MNEDMIEYLANMERRVNKLADQIEDLKNIMLETFRREGGPQICPHRYEWVQSKRINNVEVHTYVCSLCGKTLIKTVDKSE